MTSTASIPILPLMFSDLRVARALSLGMAVMVLASAAPAEGEKVGAFDHSSFNEILSRSVDENRMIDYAGILKDRAPLDLYITELGRVSPAALRGWNREEQMAFYINAYNAITIKRILDHYPPEGSGLIHPRISIRNIDGVWDELKTRVAGEEITLDHIEHQILRPKFKDPRVHAAINCASIGCPPILNAAYTAEKLEEQLEEQARLFARDAQRNAIDRQRKVVELSPIFDWFHEDFDRYAADVPKLKGKWGKKGKLAGGVGFLLRYGDADNQTFLKSGDYKLKTGDYDWGLNTQ